MTLPIALVGECYSDEEDRAQTPFVGRAGWALNMLLEDAGINRGDCYVTTVFPFVPPNGDIKNLCGPKRDDSLGLPPIALGKYLNAQHSTHLERLYGELSALQPNIVVALGSTALWALTHTAGISRSRGTVMPAVRPAGLKVIGTFAPGYVVKVADSRPIVIADLQKAKRQSAFPEIRRPAREIIIEPTLSDLAILLEECRHAERISVDIETARNVITCIGFATSHARAWVIPFFDNSRGGCFWPTHSDEIAAWGIVRAILALPVPKLFQNGLYDVHWLWRRYGLAVRNFDDDTMLLHHALQPELQKGLAFMGSIYTDEPAWKLERPKTKRDRKVSKKEDT